jgi:hypothetical protein
VDKVEAGDAVAAPADLVANQSEDSLVEGGFLWDELNGQGNRLANDPIGDDVAFAGTVDEAGKQVEAFYSVADFDPLPGGASEVGEGLVKALALGRGREIVNQGARVVWAPVGLAEEVVKTDNGEVLLAKLVEDELVAKNLGVNEPEQGVEVAALVVNRGGGKA